MNSPELQPAQSFAAEVERFLKHKYETNRYSKMSAESKRSCLNLFADSVKNRMSRNSFLARGGRVHSTRRAISV